MYMVGGYSQGGAASFQGGGVAECPPPQMKHCKYFVIFEVFNFRTPLCIGKIYNAEIFPNYD